MSSKPTYKLVLIVFLIALFGWSLVPTVNYLGMSVDERAQMRLEDREGFETMVKQAIKLGLDLQGGVRLVLEIDLKDLLRELANEGTVDGQFTRLLNEASDEAGIDDGNIVVIFDRKLQDAGIDIAKYYRNRSLRDREAVLLYLTEQKNDAVDRALEVLRNRVDEFGVSEPIIQKQGASRIIVELAGITDPRQARELVGKTAKLEFSLLKDANVAERAAKRVNDYLLSMAGPGTVVEDSTSDDSDAGESDSTTVSAEDLFGSTDTTKVSGEELFNTGDSSNTAAASDNTLFQILGPGYIFIKENDVDRFKAAMQDSALLSQIDREVLGARFLLHSKRIQTQDTGESLIQAYFVDRNVAVDGSTIIDASHNLVDRTQIDNAMGGYQANIRFNDDGSRRFAVVTGANVGKRLAIVLDDRVQSAPNIQERINGGRARITGLETNDEARILSSVLKAGSLPAPLKIIEERSVGASLGADSVNKGLFATLLGLGLVAIFMIIYYKTSGMLANIALFLNIIFLMGTMSTMHATLTLPGIAGIILTIGMAVDANVLIFERIREELDRGKSTWAALDTGYSKAFITILDANVTTFIAGVVLYNFGSGPVRGFATTLMIGIVASMFTAIFVTRALSEFILSRKSNKEISI